MNSITPRPLEQSCNWTAPDVSNPDDWTLQLSKNDVAEINSALEVAKRTGRDFLDISKTEFPLPNLSAKLKTLESDLMTGRGFGLIRGLPRDNYDNNEMCMIYWGIGAHLGKPWPQNKHGHMLGDVTDQGRRADDPEARGNEIGGMSLDFHTDGCDLVGLLCLNNGKSGGESAVCNSVTIYNRMVEEAPELAAELFKPQPYDFRGEQGEGAKAWYEVPVFTEHKDRIFIRYIRPYILASQRHEDAPRITELAEQAMQYLDRLILDENYHVYMMLQPGDMQFVNNYHVLHARKAYQDDRDNGQVRHLKRLWLETEILEDRPVYFANNVSHHWSKKKVISRMDAL